uniref:alpha-L-fucosidase n=1 Tax=Kalanchoe fedtschenkoi TaxID=63787 RepID=A0A7N0U5T8_KALFE
MAYDAEKHVVHLSLALTLFLSSFNLVLSKLAIPPPLPIPPLPTSSQLKWQQRELIMFLHFGVNTFSDSEWGTGREDPSSFSPMGLNATQWVEAGRVAGASLMILTAKHHDGFCLWPSRYTDHSVRASRWRGGRGDVVGEFAAAAEAHRVDIGLYLSPWDRHDPRYGRDLEYNEFYLAQLQELLTRYGSVKEIWFDGAKGANGKNMTYYFEDWFGMVKELQGSINIFSDAGPGIRWVGDEKGSSGTTCWSTINQTSLSIGNGSIVDYLRTGDPRGTHWLPPECDVSIRSGWFWHKSESPKSLAELLEIYYNSVGRNCVMLLNVPPNTTGLVPEADIARLTEFRTALDEIFSTNLAARCEIRLSSERGGKGGGFGRANLVDEDHLWTYWAPDGDCECDHADKPKKRHHWIEIEGSELRFNVIRIQEAIGLGQRVKRHEIYVDGKRLVKGTTVGYKRLHRLETAAVNASSVKIKILDSKGLPLISSIGLHFDPYWYQELGK